MTDAPNGRNRTPREEQLLRQQAALSDFGHLALCSQDLDTVLQRAAELVAQGLDTKLAKVLEVRPEGLLVRAGVGWNPGVVGHAVLPADHRSAPGYALETDGPVITGDTDSEDRFEISDLLRDHGVRSVINTPIVVPDTAPYGVLEVDSRERRDFTQDDVEFLRTYAHLIGAAVDRLRRERELRAGVEEREVLLRELQHRVMNNLQVVTSLLAMEIRRAPGPKSRAALERVAARIEPLRLLHDKLYKGRHVDRVNLRAYLSDLCAEIIDFHGEQARHVRLTTSLAHLTVHADAAVPLGLIANEFITNSVKHAFDGRPGEIAVDLQADGPGRATLILRDNGKGLQRAAAGSGSGHSLIAALVRQVGGRAEWKAEAGTELRLDFPCA